MKDPVRISRHFTEELDNLTERLVAIGRLVEERIRVDARSPMYRSVCRVPLIFKRHHELDAVQRGQTSSSSVVSVSSMRVQQTLASTLPPCAAT